MRQVVLDTETTGLEPNMGHRIIEIGAVEMVNRKLTGRHYHEYINPERDIDDGALEVHGISREFLRDKPVFANVADSFLEFVEGAELVIHNAAFDVSFLNYELNLLQAGKPQVDKLCEVVDSLAVARRKHPGQKNNLDALCRRYHVDNSQRELHGALLDAEILADVYLLMTGGQTSLFGGSTDTAAEEGAETEALLSLSEFNLPLIPAQVSEAAEHEAFLELLNRESGQQLAW
ncbi:MAG: DNA polymerase III subunit epsilon [Pseudomonadota bacterium]